VATSVRTPAPVGEPGGREGGLERDGELNMEGAHGRRKEQGRYLSSSSSGKQRVVVFGCVGPYRPKPFNFCQHVFASDHLTQRLQPPSRLFYQETNSRPEH
jgi:hypothetical protein